MRCCASRGGCRPCSWKSSDSCSSNKRRQWRLPSTVGMARYIPNLWRSAAQPRTRMPLQSGLPTCETLPPGGRVHVLGAGPVGLVMTALLQSTGRFSVHLYEKRRDYTRTR
ncbi:MAG: NAD(P)-binding protein, partial [Gemmatimonadales bacterium]